ncbi:MAG: ATP-binding domain-containing protein [Proteobacteria bacterium]|nr:ATP-binding domain-containing protein [Pseudomonadota bacterium]
MRFPRDEAVQDHPIIQDELELLDRVRILLEEQPYDLPPSEAGIVAELLRIRDEIVDAKEEDKGALMEQYHRQIALLEQLREARKRPQVDPDSPYFAHIRLRENGRERDLCLGKATRIQRGIRIVDWRDAPISKIFYRYQQGEEYEEDIGERALIGEVVARRTVAIRGGKLEGILSPDGSFSLRKDGEWHVDAIEAPRMAGGEGAAMRAHDSGKGMHRRLGTDLEGHRRRSDKRLPDIAGLIDTEQFELITQPQSGFVVIRGTAGSGKTTVALHRIAYLAYDDPRIDSKATMFVVFSKALRDYVAHVLPALGVENAQVRSFGDWAREQRRNHFNKLPRKVRDDTPAVVLKLKNHPAILAALEEQVRTVDGRNTREQALDDWMSVMVNAPLLKRVFARVAPGSMSDAEIDRVTTWARDRNEELVNWLEGEREISVELDAEDDALLLRAWQLRVGRLRRRGRPLVYRHIAIDEVQDFSPIEVRVLLETLDKNRSITLAGDTQQHVMQDAGFTSWADFFGHLGVRGTAVNTLRIAYRSSHPIVSFAVDLLGEYWEDDNVPVTTRGGPPVELFKFTDHGATVAFLSDVLRDLIRAEPLASVAVLTPGRDMSRLYYDGLDKGEVPRLRLVEDQVFTFAPGVEVTEVQSVKGLEFDYVILVETSAQRYPDTPTARRVLHVGATRAVHQLWITCVGTLSPVVREAVAKLPG